jgi:CNT family concentrative nucleoside transporter
MVYFIRALFGIIVFLLLAFILSENKKKINWKLVINGLFFQVIIAILILKVPFINDFFTFIASIFEKAYQVSLEGSSFIFGDDLVKNNKLGFIFAFRILPTIIFFSAISSLLYYLKVLPFIVGLFSKIMQKLLKITGAESLSVAANIFLGHTEAPLIVKPYIANMTRSELNTLITGGFATITGAVLAALIGIMGGDDPELRTFYAKHFLVASIISAPAAIIISKIIVPETEDISSKNEANIEGDKSENVFDALANGTFDGLKLSLNVAAMIIVFLSIIALLNIFLHDIIGDYTKINESIAYSNGLSLEYIFGIIASPFAWLMGIDWNDAILCGQLIGEKTVFNEFVAYSSLNEMMVNNLLVDKRSIIIISYGICGFANFGSIGIMIGAISTLAPSRKSETAILSIKALIGGSFACFITACIAGVLI